jgi:hypothetical protein
MSIQENLKAKLPNARNGIVRFMGETLHVKLLTQAEYRKQKFSGGESDDAMAAFVADKFLDPSTGKPAFTVQFLRDELPYSKLGDLLKLYFKTQTNGGIEESEKNSGATPKE